MVNIPGVARLRGGVLAAAGLAFVLALAPYDAADPSWNASSKLGPRNLLGGFGANVADFGMQSLGLAAWVAAGLMVFCGLARVVDRDPDANRRRIRLRALVGVLALLALAAVLAAPAPPADWPLARSLGGFWGDGVLQLFAAFLKFMHLPGATVFAAVTYGLLALVGLAFAIGLGRHDATAFGQWLIAVVTRRPQAPQPKTARPPAVRKTAARAAPAAYVHDDLDEGD